jgi:hypothetical protein
VGAGVKMHNDNFVAIDIHALSFDMFYPDWKGSLQHIGHVHDVNQKLPEEIEELITAATDSPADRDQKDNLEDSSSTSTPLWALQPRQSFETIDTVLMQPPTALSLSVLSNLSWDMVKMAGKINLPSSGVIHLKANRQVPLTISMLCDNLLNTWTMELEGRHCTMDAMELGWMNMQNSVQKLRQKVLLQTQNTEDFVIDMSVVAEPKKLSFQEEFDRLQRKHALEEFKTSALNYFGHYPTREEKKNPPTEAETERRKVHS